MDETEAKGKDRDVLVIDERPLSLSQTMSFVFQRATHRGPVVSDACLERVRKSEQRLHQLMDQSLPIYGVTTGFGDSSYRLIPPDRSEELQRNLVAYLLCGTGKLLPRVACRATMLFVLQSMCRGYSGVSPDLVERLQLFLERDWIPTIPREGSLGASGDLIPLAYIAQALQGDGEVFDPHSATERTIPLSELLAKAKVPRYTLKPKEGLALVNGTAAMSGLSLVNLSAGRYLTELGCLMTSWLCLGLQGRTESFEPLVNEQAKTHQGQARVARSILSLLNAESYGAQPLGTLPTTGAKMQWHVQDRYSLRCTPQVLGPVVETLDQASCWLEIEASGASDNPLIDPDPLAISPLAMGGNFYGGYLAQGMDYLKISLAHLTDLMDRQLMSLIDEKSNRGLPPNLAAWDRMPESERHLHHGLKGLHQAVGALTSEILAKATPNGIFSRSSESHNQDKVSLGMSAAVQCHEMIDQVFTVAAIYLICLAQALDLRGVQIVGPVSRYYYDLVRSITPFIDSDRALERPVRELANRLRAHSQDPNATERILQ
jgi:histidine ammonia-lyase/phenylalanine ammonia-lyase